MDRKTKRELARLEKDLRDRLVPLTETYTSRFISNMMDPDIQAMDDLYVRLNRNWRTFANNIIERNPKIYSTGTKRAKLVNTFSTFVEGFNKKLGQPLDDI